MIAFNLYKVNLEIHAPNDLAPSLSLSPYVCVRLMQCIGRKPFVVRYCCWVSKPDVSQDKYF